MALPILPPVHPMLAKLEREIPRGPRGDEWLYEPKWDGFRAIAFRDGDSVHIGSRNTKPLQRYFPEMVDTLKACLPERAVVDGEIVIAGEYGLDFDALQLRIHPAASRIKTLAKDMPSTFVAFDLLAIDSNDLCDSRFDHRRELLESRFLPTEAAFITPQTSDFDVATQWFDLFEGAGLDGIIAKPRDVTYRQGERATVKIKHKRTADCVVGGYRMSKEGDGVGSLLLGVYSDGSLHFLGHTASFKATEKRELLARFEPMRTDTTATENDGGFGFGRSPGGMSRWSAGQDKEWIPVEPQVVCEVAFDHLQGLRFRHGTTFVRFRTDKDPLDCTFDQFESPARFDIEQIRTLS
ncbi:MAG: ATP-dependent DNA ligase [Actinomycetota bacterium]|nr:ATP-dependent DNA ligase [Actinomycetota bacterium]